MSLRFFFLLNKGEKLIYLSYLNAQYTIALTLTINVNIVISPISGSHGKRELASGPGPQLTMILTKLCCNGPTIRKTCGSQSVEMCFPIREENIPLTVWGLPIPTLWR